MDKELIFSIVRGLKPLECDLLGEHKVKLILENVKRKNASIASFKESEGFFNFGEHIELIMCVLATMQTVIALLSLIWQIKNSIVDKKEIATMIIAALETTAEIDEEKKELITDLIEKSTLSD